MTGSGSRRRSRLIVFDDHWSYLHLALGAVTRVLASLGAPWLAIAILLAFIAWEVNEQEKVYCKLGDFVEFLVGYVLADLALSLPR